VKSTRYEAPHYAVVGTSHSAKQTVSTPSVLVPNRQSHLHSQQLNAKSTSSSSRGLQASHSASALKIYEHRAGSPTQQALLAYVTGCITSRRSERHQRRPTTIQCAPRATGAFRKEDLRPSSMSPRNRCASSPHQQFVTSGPFQGQPLPACVRVMTAENSGVST
jgi:hypothetical protein